MSARYYEAVGRRKTSTARVRLYPGTGTIVVNERKMEEYFPRADRCARDQSPVADDRHGEQL